MKTCKHNNRLSLGIILIVIGLVYLLGNIGFIPEDLFYVLTRWPMILIVIGIYNLVKCEFTSALVLLAIGSYFLIPDIFPQVAWHDIWQFWPILLILVGIKFIFSKGKYSHNINMVVTGDETLDEVSVFGGRVSQIESQNFKGGKITAVFGGSEIHLTKAKLSEHGAVIDLAVVFGGTKIFIPRDWQVKVDVVSIFGGFTDKRMYPSVPIDSNKILLIKGSAIFGGGELVNS